MKLQHLPEPSLQFGETPNYEVSDPRYGLTRFRPFDVTRERAFNSIRAIAIGPQSQREKFQTLWNSLLNGVERQAWEPDYREGLATIYQLESVELATHDEGYIPTNNFPGSTVDKYESAIRYVNSNFEFDVLFIIEPEEPIHYLYPVLKRDCISLRVSSQYIEIDTLDKHTQGSVLHNLAVATYAKVGGIPWRVKNTTFSNSCVLGLSFHKVRPQNPSQPERTVVGVAEILDEYGRHLTLNVAQKDVPNDSIKEFQREFRSLYVPKDLMEDLVKNALEVTQWPSRTVPTRLVIHKTTDFHEEEISGIQSALETLELNMEYALIHVKEETVQRVYRTDDKDTVRGLLLTLNDEIPEAVLWTVGKVPAKYYDKKEREMKYYEKSGTKLGTSDPIAVYLDPASRCPNLNILEAANQVFALTKMRWNTVEMSIRLPVSIYLARRVGTFVTAAERHQADMSFLPRVDARHFW